MESEPYAFTLEQATRNLGIKPYDPETALEQVAMNYRATIDPTLSDAMIETQIRLNTDFIQGTPIQLVYSLIEAAQAKQLLNMVSRCVQNHISDPLFLTITASFARKLHYMSRQEHRSILAASIDSEVARLQQQLTELNPEEDNEKFTTDSLAKIAKLNATKDQLFQMHSLPQERK